MQTVVESSPLSHGRVLAFLTFVKKMLGKARGVVGVLPSRLLSLLCTSTNPPDSPDPLFENQVPT